VRNVRLIEAAGDLIHDPALYQVSMLTESELAIAGAALELGAQARPVDAALLLTHARRTFRAGHDLVAALESLENRGWLLIDRVSEFHIADVRAAIGPLEEVAIGGRCQDRLARLPVVDLARAVWETSLGMVAPTLHLALLGVGWPIPGREIEQVHIAKMRSTRRLGPFHGCLVIGDLEGVPIYAAASTEADQVGALEEAWSGATGEIGGCTFSVRTIFSVPSSRLRGRRWSVVADDLVGCHVTRSDEAGHQMSLRSQLEMTVALRDAIRDATLLAERAVAGVEEQVHIHYQMKGSETTIVDVLGQEPGVTQVNCLDPWWIGDSLVALRFAEQLSLPSEFRVGKMVTGSWHSDLHPIRAIARDIENDIQSFNKHHPRVQVDAQQGSLERWLLPLMERRYQDAMQLYERLKTSDLERPSRCEVFLLGVESLVFSLPGINATLATRPSLTSSVHYRLKNRPSGGTNRIALNEEFPNSTGLPISSGSLAWVLARLSGYSEDDLQVHP
jgi:hypothetical protein